MDKELIKPFVAARVAKEFKDGDFVNLGIGLPTLIPNYLPAGVNIIVQSDNGIIGIGPKPDDAYADPLYVTDAGGGPATIFPGGSFNDSCTAFGIVRGGHVDVTVLGALQVDEQGNLSNWSIPGRMMAGMGGAMDLVVGAKRVIVAMEHTSRGAHKIMQSNTLPLTAVKCVDLIVTEMGVMEVSNSGILLTEYNPEFALEEILAATNAHLEISPDLKPMI